MGFQSFSACPGVAAYLLCGRVPDLSRRARALSPTMVTLQSVLY